MNSIPFHEWAVTKMGNHFQKVGSLYLIANGYHATSFHGCEGEDKAPQTEGPFKGIILPDDHVMYMDRPDLEHWHEWKFKWDATPWKIGGWIAQFGISKRQIEHYFEHDRMKKAPTYITHYEHTDVHTKEVVERLWTQELQTLWNHPSRRICPRTGRTWYFDREASIYVGTLKELTAGIFLRDRGKSLYDWMQEGIEWYSLVRKPGTYDSDPPMKSQFVTEQVQEGLF